MSDKLNATMNVGDITIHACIPQSGFSGSFHKEKSGHVTLTGHRENGKWFSEAGYIYLPTHNLYVTVEGKDYSKLNEGEADERE